MTRPIPVCLLTGYLGSGKTTLMNYILNQNHGYKVAVIVNDVGEVNIDARLIAKGGNIQEKDSGSLVSLSNGCACCTLKADLLEQLAKLCASGKFDYILIEASGGGDPVPMAQTIAMMDQALGREEEEPLCYLDNIVSVADAYRFVQEFSCGEAILNKEVEEEDIEALLINQLEFCNTILLNKVDLVSEEELEHVRSVIKALNPGAKLIETNHSKVDMKEILGTDAFDFDEVASSAGWIKALEKDEEEEEEHEHEHHHHDDDDDDEDEHEHHHHDDDDDDEDEHEHHHHEHDENCTCGCHDHDHEEHEHEHHHEHDENCTCGCHDHDHEEHEHHHEHDENCTCGCHDHHHHHHHVKYGIETFVYYRRRPLNMDRFKTVVQNWRANVIRSKGFVWFDDDREHAYIYEQAGKQITLDNDGLWVDAEEEDMKREILEANPELLEEWDEVYGDRMIRLAIIGQKLDKKKMIAELDAALGE